MENEKFLQQLSIIQRSLGVIEGVAWGLDEKCSHPIYDALEVIDAALEVIKDGK